MNAQNSTTSEQGFILFYCKYCLVNINSDLFKTCKAIINPQYGWRSPWLALSILPIPNINNRRTQDSSLKSSAWKGFIPRLEVSQSQTTLGQKKFMGPTKYFGSEEYWGPLKILILEISWVQKNCESKNILGSKKVAWTNVTMTVGIF